MDVVEGSGGVPGSLRMAPVNSSRKGEPESGVATRLQPLLMVLMVAMCLGSVTGNLLVIILVATTKTLQQMTSVLIMNLAISDLLVGLGVMPFVVLSIMKPGWAEHFNLCLFVGYTSSVYCTASVLTLAAIALDRYHSIVDCLRYKSRCTLWRSCLVVLWIWLQAMATSCPPLLGWGSVAYLAPMYNCALDWANSPSYTATMISLSYLMPAVIILFCYAKIVKVARKHARTIHSLEESVQHSTDPNSMFPCSLYDSSILIYHLSGHFVSEVVSAHPTSSKRVFSMWSFSQVQQDSQQHHHGVTHLFLVIFIFFLCWTPYIGVAVFQVTERAISGQTTLVPTSAVIISYFLVLLNSNFNPLLYALLSKRFQGALMGLTQKLRAGMGSVVNWGGEVDRCSLPTRHPGVTPSLEESRVCSPVFPISNDSKHHLSENICKACLPEAATPSCSTWQDPYCARSVDCLQVPFKPQEGGRLPFSALTTDPRATFVYGQITVEVEHVSTENLLIT
ncbi:beta-3 adrenergic receptor [Syngnathoides biaculeatus]|uniref:beta-3 adrenergic receptor n=1 Tax=Syngnathoides biaculeatus TaxID=300417 RepID=UPI002ADDE613|nr:beta-3 adrenergic receptor [Syngnathoides biaculeatus]